MLKAGFAVALRHLSSMKTEAIWYHASAITPLRAILSQSILTQYNLEGAVFVAKNVSCQLLFC